MEGVFCKLNYNLQIMLIFVIVEYLLWASATLSAEIAES
jgi:hypothetical protein